ncbi:putative Protein kinase domain-containing protein [Seiridium cardinale]|uniref:Protein kinase domain-containing protein n=1 Tax=Seiridium cardinale TaxID=138064 RepID=A0ABR2XN61_9PEZI
MGPIYVSKLDADSVIKCPQDYCYEPNDSLDAQWRTGYDTMLCWKTCLIYEQINTAHRRLVPFVRRDAWTGFPVLARPSGSPLKQFLAEHKLELYPQALIQSAACRVVDRCRPLVYQWALHALSALAFMHSHDLICGDFNEDLCWLSASPSLSLSLVGFPFAGYRRHDHGSRYYEAEFYGGDTFSEMGLGPARGGRRPSPTRQFDLYQWACMVFRLMTSYFPGDRMGLNETEIASLVSRKACPVLEPEFIGNIVRKCWNGDYSSAEEVKGAVISFVEEQGWLINGGDDLRGLKAAELFRG